jgi:hypothetical protein
MLLPLCKQLNRDLRSGEATCCIVHQIFNALLIVVEEFYKFQVPYRGHQTCNCLRVDF